jgi:hypothetical protein
MEIDIEDNIVRAHDKYVRMLYLRLGNALQPHTKIAKAHAATMKEAAFTWQQRAIKLIEEATCNVQIDNKKTIKDIQNEAQRSANELRKQLEELTKKHSDLQTEYNFARAALTLKEQSKIGQDSATSANKITELTLELGEQRKSNEELRKQMHELFVNFTEYRAGRLKDSIEQDVKEKRKGEPDLNDRRKNRDSESPTWGKVRETTPSSSDWETNWGTKGDSSTSQSDFNNGWGNPPPRRKDRRRSPPKDDRRSERQRSPTSSRSSNRDSNYKKRPASPSKEAQPVKRTLSRDAWIAGGKEAVSLWTGVDQLRRTIRSLGLSDVKNMITRVKEADTDLKELFYRNAIPFHQRANEESSKYLSLHKELGIPGHNGTKRRSASLNFYYAKVLKLCYDHQNSLTIKEATDVAMVDLFEETIEHNKKESNPYEHYDDTYILSSAVSTLGEHTRERRDHKKAGYRLWLQEKDMLEYHRLRFEFFDKVFLKRDMQDLVPLSSFLSKEDVMEVNDDLRRLKQMLGKETTKPTKLFKDIYARVYKDHYQEIMEQIEAFAIYGTPIQKFLSYKDIDTVFYIDTGADTQGEF